MSNKIHAQNNTKGTAESIAMYAYRHHKHFQLKQFNVCALVA